MIRKHSLGVSTNLDWVNKDEKFNDVLLELKGDCSFESTK